MKFFKTFLILLFMICFVGNINLNAQRRNHSRGVQRAYNRGYYRGYNSYNQAHQRFYYRSQFRPVVIERYHPVWAPNRFYNRRWIYFPRYNFYYDNWRQAYWYENNHSWFYNSSPPPTTVKIKIEDVKHYELKDNEDDMDSVYINNDVHKEEYPQK